MVTAEIGTRRERLGVPGWWGGGTMHVLSGHEVGETQSKSERARERETGEREQGHLELVRNSPKLE